MTCTPHVQGCHFKVSGWVCLDILEDCIKEWLAFTGKVIKYGASMLQDALSKALMKEEWEPYCSMTNCDQQHTGTDAVYWTIWSAAQCKTLVSSGSEESKELFERWSLVHQLGFIPVNAYMKPHLADGEYTVVDMLYLGVIPSQMNQVVLEMVRRIANDKKASDELIAGWDEVKAAAMVRCCTVAMTVGVRVAQQRRRSK